MEQKFELWYDVFSTTEAPLSDKDKKLFGRLESAVDKYEKSREGQKTVVKAVLERFGVEGMDDFKAVFVPADTDLWPVKSTTGEPLTPQAVCNRVTAGKPVPDWAMVSCFYLRALERGVRRANSKESSKSSKESSKSSKESTTTLDEYAMKKVRLEVYSTVLSNIQGNVGKADPVVLLSKLLESLQKHVAGLQLELTKTEGKGTKEGESVSFTF